MRFPAHRAAFIDVGCPIWAFLFDAGDITLQAGHMPVARAGTIDTLGGGCDGGAELLLVAAHEPQTMVIMWMFPKIEVPPKSSILIGFSTINHPFWGTLFLETLMWWKETPFSKPI